MVRFFVFLPDGIHGSGIYQLDEPKKVLGMFGGHGNTLDKIQGEPGCPRY
jgi:hypothetical protein